MMTLVKTIFFTVIICGTMAAAASVAAFAAVFVFPCIILGIIVMIAYTAAIADNEDKEDK